MEVEVNTWATLITEWSFRLVVSLAILYGGWRLGDWLGGFVRRSEKLDPTLVSFLSGLIKYTIFAVALITAVTQLGVKTASLIAVLGAAGLAIGLALQGTLSNVAAGVMILFLRPFNVGDYIAFGDDGGTVKSLGLFGTELATPDNVYLFAPNSQIWSGEIYNYSRNLHRRQDIKVGISYNDDINKAFKAIEKVIKKEDRILAKEGKMPEIMVEAMGDSSVNIIVRIWSKSSDYWALKWDVTKAIKEALDNDGITIPFPTRTLVIEGGGEFKATKKSSKAA